MEDKDTDAKIDHKSTSEYIDKITLELLINKKQYNKYIASVDPEKHKKITEFSDKLAKYNDQIMSLTEEYCSNPKTQKTTEMDEMFVNYAKSCFRYFEMKELEGDPDCERGNEYSEEDVLFANIPAPAQAQGPIHSFWGKGAKKKY